MDHADHQRQSQRCCPDRSLLQSNGFFFINTHYSTIDIKDEKDSEASPFDQKLPANLLKDKWRYKLDALSVKVFDPLYHVITPQPTGNVIEWKSDDVRFYNERLNRTKRDSCETPAGLTIVLLLI